MAMTIPSCPKCGHEPPVPGAVCPECGAPLSGVTPQDIGTASPTTNPPSMPVEKLSPELLTWLRKEFNEEEFSAGLANVRETGGMELKDFIHELEQEASPRE